MRGEVARHYLMLHETGQRSFQFDRMGRSLLSGGDNDLAACACDLGLGLGIMASLKLRHLIPPERLSADYLARLVEGIHFSSALLDHSRGLPVCRRSWGRRVLDLVRLLKLREPHRSIQTAAIRSCDRAADSILKES